MCALFRLGIHSHALCSSLYTRMPQNRHTGMDAGIQGHGRQLAGITDVYSKYGAAATFTSLCLDSGIHAGMTDCWGPADTCV
jgi:hypothetical protein